MQPHRGTTILVLGILGIVLCQICGIIAWVMANKDLAEMAAGRMDISGEGTTKAGKVCGIISVVILIIGAIIAAIMIPTIIAAATAAAAAASEGLPTQN